MIRRMAKKRAQPYGNTEWGDRLFLARQALALSQDQFADACGLDRLEYRKLESDTKKLSLDAAESLARGFGVPLEPLAEYLQGRAQQRAETFARSKPALLSASSQISSTLLRRLADRVGLQLDEVVTLAGETGGGMDEFSESLRRGVLGIVHVLGVPLETAIAAARVVVSERGDQGLDAEEWFTSIRKRLPKKPESGTFPSSSKIKLPTKSSK